MTHESFARTLRAFARQQPFRPFRVHLVDGQVLDVQHPEALVTRGAVAVLFHADGEMSIFEADGVARIQRPRPSNGRASRVADR